MTELRYQTDSYLREYDTIVAGHSETNGESAVLLAGTVLYPGGGGQPADTGVLTWNDRQATVTRATKQGADIAYLLDGPLPPIGATVRMRVDWERRYRLMRTHTAMHCLCGVVFRDYGALVTGGQMALDQSRMDFELDDLSPERVAAIEEATNAAIRADLPIRVRILPRDEAFAIPDLIRTKINLLPPGITEVRTVEIVGLDLQADGGTHVAHTGEVVGIRIVGTRSKGKSNKRLEIVLNDEQGA
ncbi:MAG: alanyl-tRNA editing protein [Chloroflexota bacterium]|nr:alanyl-tRNA editing protein [Chloroflexota bacterium]